MSFTDNQLKGNWGEQFIAAQLSSQDCLIRYVTQGHDAGIDLYCEKIIEGKPLLHFWCQVKTSIKWNVDKKYVTFVPEDKHIEYWLKQPIPVYIFLVPDKRDEIAYPYYICRAFDYPYTVGKNVNSLYKISKPDDLIDFLENKLVGDIYLWGLKDGSISHFKTQHNIYKKTIPIAFSIMFETKIRESLLLSLFSLSKDFFNNLTSSKPFIKDPDEVPYFDMLERLVIHLNDKHYHYYELLGDKYFFQKKYKNSLRFMEKSLSILHDDPHSTPPENLWDNEIEIVEKKIKQIKIQ